MFNVTKTAPPAVTFLYTDEVVRQQVKADFFYKCYLCEEKVPRHLQVEHFYPQVHFPLLVHDWDNLLSVCEKCNTIRPKNINTHQDNEVLNCCTEDVEQRITLRYVDKDNSVAITGDGSAKATNTVSLLDRIHNGVQTKSTSHIDLRKLIATELAKLEADISSFETFSLEVPFKEKIRKRLSRQSAFMAIKRTYIKDYNPEFTELFD